ncbi:NADH:ubiquinone oxidoreductase 11.6kD subunit [Zalerion maritima]|uniref:NADH dehydrogenase [ubiquinone] 1 beta subcomplex subunit 11, mitochondrial n=1 Tax=Zalerion maritima TaxID=339359 RepID=A0AAD5WNI4_9PEZI|nr:NADH:ubiquinone oxidoreductase 11.6kD subunit [Zalerion maritima]
MPFLRPGTVGRATRALHHQPSPSPAAASTRSFSLTTRRPAAEPRYDPPTGWLWGIKPGEKYEKEGWETPFYWLYCAPLLLTGVWMFFKPDTTIQTWALEEARRRLEKEGILEDPFPNHVEPEDETNE